MVILISLLPRRLAGHVAALTDDQIMEIFDRFDLDNSGDLSPFELSKAVTAVIHREPSTKQIMDLLHSVDNGNAEEHNTLTKDEFLTALKTFEWKARDFTAPPVSFFGGVIYECDFWKPTLGFRVKMDEQDGLLSVSDVVDDDVRPVVGIGRCSL